MEREVARWEPRLEQAEHRKDAEGDGRSEKARKVESNAEQRADGSRHPDGCRCREAAHGKAFLKNHASAEKADAGHDALGHTRRVGTDRFHGHPIKPKALI